MIDYFALALGHGLLLIAFLRLVSRDELDEEPAQVETVEREVVKETAPLSGHSGRRARR